MQALQGSHALVYRPPHPSTLHANLCRRGYDVFAFAAAGAAVSVGLDLVPEAVAAAQQEQQRQLGDNPTAAAAVHLTTGDFFTFRSSEGYKGPFDFGYDYTFLCALRPGEQRQAKVCLKWSVSMC